MRPGRSELMSAFLRTFAVQGSWNYRTLLGGGIAYALVPLLRCIHVGDPVGLTTALGRNLAPFNGHPYMCGMAVGALARLEYEDVDAATIERFREALRGPLGTIGDRLVWAAWRPFCLLSAILAAAAGASPWIAIGGFLLVYNAGHVALRGWAFRRGWEAGLHVGGTLRAAGIGRISDGLVPVNLLLLGAATAAVAVALVRAAPDLSAPIWPAPVLLGAGAVAAALAGFRWPRTGGTLATALLLSVPAVWIVLALA